MTPPLPHGVTAIRRRGQKVDDGYGGHRIDWTLSTQDITICGCAVAPRSEPEIRDDGRQGVIVGVTLYAPHGVDVAFGDRVEIPDGIFEVDGEPTHWANPYSGTRPGSVINLRRVDG